jgi:hypothetical protein
LPFVRCSDKSETRNSKHETISNDRNSNDSNRRVCKAWFVLFRSLEHFVIRICFVFRYSDFAFCKGRVANYPLPGIIPKPGPLGLDSLLYWGATLIKEFESYYMKERCHAIPPGNLLPLFISSPTVRYRDLVYATFQLSKSCCDLGLKSESVRLNCYFC